MAISNNSTGLRPGVCTSSTRPTAPYEGQHIYETDTDIEYVWNGTAWVVNYVSAASPAFTGTPTAPTATAATNTTQLATTAFANTAGGLVYVSTTTIGSGVSSVTVSNCFSVSYNNYKILVSGGAASGTTYCNIRLGTSAGADTGNVYEQSFLYTNLANTPLAVGKTSTDYTYGGSADSTGILANIEIGSPNLAGRTSLSNFAAARGSFAGLATGLINTTTQYTNFVLYPNAGTFTGGSITVYGYRTA